MKLIELVHHQAHSKTTVPAPRLIRWKSLNCSSRSYSIQPSSMIRVYGPRMAVSHSSGALVTSKLHHHCPLLINGLIHQRTGYGNHGDYGTISSQPLNHGLLTRLDAVFGWKNDSLQKAMDANCNVNCPQLKTQSIATGNKCAQKQKVDENVDGWLTELPGGMPVQ